VAALLLLALLSFGLQAISLTAQSLWRDEVDALCYAFEFPHLLLEALAPGAAGALETPCACPPLPFEPLQGRLAVRLISVVQPMVQQNGPLYFFLLRGWIALAGSGEFALRFFSLGLGVLLVPLTYALGRRLFERGVGMGAALGAAFSPYLLWYGQEVKMYTLLPLLVLLALYSLRRAVDEGGRWWAVQVAATTVAFYTHIWSALLLPVEALLLLLWWPRWRQRWIGAGISMALLTLPYLPLLRWQLGAVFVPRETGFPHYSLGGMAVVLLNGWGLGITAQGMGRHLQLVAGGLAALGLGAAFEAAAWRERLRAVLLLLGWVVIPMLGIWFVSRWQPLFTDRYLIWAAPAFYLAMGAGLAFLWRRARGLALPLLAALLTIWGYNLWYQTTHVVKPDLRGAAAVVEASYRQGDLLVFQIPHGRYTFDYYFGPSDYAWADGLYTNHRREGGGYLMSEEVVAARMADLTAGYERVWFIATEVAMWDERNLVQIWLEANGARELEAPLAHVTVYRYRQRP
jgi:mannosyltransferase